MEIPGSEFLYVGGCFHYGLCTSISWEISNRDSMLSLSSGNSPSSSMMRMSSSSSLIKKLLFMAREHVRIHFRIENGLKEAGLAA